MPRHNVWFKLYYLKEQGPRLFFPQDPPTHLVQMKFWHRFGKLVSCGRVDDSNQSSLDSHVKEYFHFLTILIEFSVKNDRFNDLEMKL